MLLELFLLTDNMYPGSAVPTIYMPNVSETGGRRRRRGEEGQSAHWKARVSPQPTLEEKNDFFGWVGEGKKPTWRGGRFPMTSLFARGGRGGEKRKKKSSLPPREWKETRKMLLLSGRKGRRKERLSFFSFSFPGHYCCRATAVSPEFWNL